MNCTNRFALGQGTKKKVDRHLPDITVGYSGLEGDARYSIFNAFGVHVKYQGASQIAGQTRIRTWPFNDAGAPFCT